MRELGLEHYIVLTNSDEDCTRLVTLSAGAVESCAWHSGAGSKGGLEESYVKCREEGRAEERGSRNFFVWRFLELGYNVLWVDPEVRFQSNPYPYLKSHMPDAKLVMRANNART